MNNSIIKFVHNRTRCCIVVDFGSKIYEYHPNPYCQMNHNLIIEVKNKLDITDLKKHCENLNYEIYIDKK